MGRSYGIEVCRNALVYLTSSKDIKSRVNESISELEVMRPIEGAKGDLSKGKYQMLSDVSQKIDEELNNDLIENLAKEIVYLCLEIVEENTKELIKQGYYSG